MKWNGMVSQLSQRIIAAAFATANAAHATAIARGRADAITHIANRLDRGCAELLPQAPNTHVDDIRLRIEVIAPDLREELLAADHLARVPGEVMQQPELPIGEVGRTVVHT